MNTYRHILILLLLSISSLSALNYNNKPEVKKFIAEMHKNYNYKTSYLQKIFSQVRENPYIKRKASKPKKIKHNIIKVKKGPWDKYSDQNTEQNRSLLGAEFMKTHQKSLERAHKEFGVAPEYITAIIGIESYYGKNRGRYYVFDQLTKLAFKKGRQQKLYRYELREFLRMCYREGVEPRAIKGSASGAIGLGQFLPSNYKKFAVDFNKDGKTEMNNYDDAIASIANYFKLHGWNDEEPVTTRVNYEGNRFYGLKTGIKHKYQRKYLPNIYPKTSFNYKKEVMLIKLERAKYDELWYGAKNFYVLTRYNHSSYYAMAVHQLSQKIKTSYNAQYTPKETIDTESIYISQKENNMSEESIKSELEKMEIKGNLLVFNKINK